MTTTAAAVTNPNHAEAVRRADAELARVVARDVELDAQVRRCTAVLDPFSAIHNERRVSEEERLEAMAVIHDARVESAKVKLQRRRLEAERAEAFETARAEAAAALEVRKRAALDAHIADVMKARRSALAVQQVQLQEHEVVGAMLDPLFLWALTNEAFNHWAGTLRSYGYADLVQKHKLGQ